MERPTTDSAAKKPQILVFIIGSLGDTLVTVPALRAARRHFREAEFTILQNIPAHGNIVRASEVIPHELVDNYIEYSGMPGKIGKIVDYARLWSVLVRRRFEAIVYLVPSERAAEAIKRDRMFFRAAGIKRFYGFHAFSKEELFPAASRNGEIPPLTKSEAERKLLRFEMDGIASLPADSAPPMIDVSTEEFEKARIWLEARRKNKAARLIAIAPGCKTAANLWAADNFAEIGKKLLNEGNCELLIVGGRGEREVAQKLIDEWGGRGINSAGEFSVRESAALLSLCDFYFGLDTGAAHLAAAVGTRCFVVFGERVNPRQWCPIGRGHTLVFHPVPCADCLHMVCPLAGHPCMNGIKVDPVWEHLQEFMRGLDNSETAPTKIFAV